MDCAAVQIDIPQFAVVAGFDEPAAAEGRVVATALVYPVEVEWWLRSMAAVIMPISQKTINAAATPISTLRHVSMGPRR
jgi:hypothetical protein